MNDINQINDLLLEDVKRHYAKREESKIVNLGIVNDINNRRKNEKINTNNNEEKISFKEKIINSLCIKTGMILIVMAGIFFYPQLPDIIKNNNIINWIKSEYRNSYSKEIILDNIEEYSKLAYSKVENVIPLNIKNEVVDTYICYIKPLVLGNIKYIDNRLNIHNTVETVPVFSEENINSSLEDNFVFAQSVTTSSEISQMDLDIQEILAKNINISCPVKGTVTSIYGAREEVFKNVGYHTGVDIANVLNTPVCSATDGVVVKTQDMDKYYGNNIEIENNGVIFKYAHLNQINVKVGDNISTGDVIGLMGSTGASTGSHLHFEIKINGRTVDPELLVNVR